MPINPVTARIDVMVNGQSMLDRLANTYVQLNDRAQASSVAIQAWDQTHGRAIQTAGGFFNGLNNVTNAMNRNIQAMEESNRSTSRFSGNVATLVQSMVIFGTLLPIINQVLPQTLIARWQQAVQVAGEFSDKMIAIRQIAGDMNDSQFAQMSTKLQQLSVQWGLNTADMDQARKVMSTTNVVADDMNSSMDQVTKGLTLFNDVSKLSTAASTTVANAWDTLATVSDTLHLTVSQVPQAMDLVFETVKTGRNTIEDFNTAGARFLPVWQSVINSAPQGQQMDRLNEVFGIYSQMSLALGSQAAGTGMTQVMRNIQRPNRAMLEVIQAARSQGIDLRPQEMNIQGPGQYLSQIGAAIGPNSKLIQQTIDRQIQTGAARPEDRQAIANSLADWYANQIFGVRSIRGVSALQDVSQFKNIMQQRAQDLAQGSPVERAAQLRQQQDLPMAEQRREAAVRRLQIGISQNVLPMLVDANNKVADLLSSLVDTDQFQRADVVGKIQMAASTLISNFASWYQTGGGQAQIQSAAYQISRGLGEFITAFVGGGEGQSIFGQVGGDIAKAIGAGFKDTLPNVIGGFLTGGLGQGILTTMLLKSSGFGLASSVIGGVTGSNLLQGAAGLPGELLAGGGLGLLGYGLLRRTGSRMANTRLPLIGRTAGEVGEGVVDEAFQRNFMQAMEGLGVPNLRDPATGRFMNIGQAQRRRVQAAGVTPRANRMRSMARLGATGLGLAAGVLPLLQEGANGGGIDTRSLFQAGGTVLGTIGGAFIPGLGEIGVGEMLGGAAGQAGGGALYDWMFGPGGPMGTRGTGMGAGVGDLPQNQQDFIQMMVMSLNLSDINTNLLNLLQITSRGAVGGTTVRAGATTGGGAARTGTGGGALSANFIDQFSSKELTPSQAQAACGPAAASFFEAAYGRQPTLAEAYALQNTIQGGGRAGFDIANNGGSDIGSLVTNINRGAGRNVASAIAANQFNGGQGGPGWGTLAQAANQGVPGIINIGPNSATNFPGHFLQVAGWNPQTNEFNVGVSGTTISKWGGKAWMTPEEMAAIGPISGAITGTSAGLTGGITGTGGAGVAAAATRAGSNFNLNVSSPYAQMAYDAGIKAGMSPDQAQIFARQMGWESGNFSADVISGARASSAGAQGIAQIMPSIAKAAGVNPLDPKAALVYAANRDMAAITKYHGNMQDVLAGYNAGEGAVDSGAAFGYGETQNYINRILGTGAGTGTGPGGDDSLGGGITVNGPLIGVANMNNDEDIRVTATKLVAELRRVARGGTSSQHDQIKP